jgi:hypothetical protein
MVSRIVVDWRQVAVEPIDWSAVRSHPEWTAATAGVCGTIAPYPRTFVPGPTLPGQLRQVHSQTQLQYLQPGTIPQGSVVLLPFVVNHLLEQGSLPANLASELASWLALAEQRGCRIVMADLYTEHVNLWQQLLSACGRTNLPLDLFRFPNAMLAQAPLYPAGPIADYRTARMYPQMATARVLVIDESGWRFLGGTA